MLLDRRTLIGSLAGASAFPAMADPLDREDFAHPFRQTSGLHDQIAMLIYPKMTVLDLVGPYHFLCFMAGAKVHLVTNQPDLKVVVGDAGMGIQPTTTMADCPADLALLFTPGGTTGTLAAARDPATLEFLQDRGRRARFISSVCTGSLILGAAGLLRGRRATSHWSVLENLAQFGAIPVHQRVVEDGNVITAAGVSAGLDSGASLVAHLRGRPLAEAATLASEYAPEPPFRGGTVASARPEISRAVAQELRSFIEDAKALGLASATAAR